MRAAGGRCWPREGSGRPGAGWAAPRRCSAPARRRAWRSGRPRLSLSGARICGERNTWQPRCGALQLRLQAALCLFRAAPCTGGAVPWSRRLARCGPETTCWPAGRRVRPRGGPPAACLQGRPAGRVTWMGQAGGSSRLEACRRSPSWLDCRQLNKQTRLSPGRACDCGPSCQPGGAHPLRPPLRWGLPAKCRCRAAAGPPLGGRPSLKGDVQIQ